MRLEAADQMRPVPTLAFDEAFEVVSDGGRRLAQRAYTSQGSYPVIDQGEALVGGYCSDSSLVYNGPLPVLVFGDHTRRVKFVDFRFVVGADGTKLLRPRNGMDPRFAFYHLLGTELRDRGYARHMSELRKARFWCPSAQVQHHIVETLERHFARLDAATASLGAALRKADQFSRSLLYSALLGHSGSDAATSVQEGPTEPWTEVRLGEVVEFLNGYAFKSEWYCEGGVGLVRGQNIGHGSLDWSDRREISLARAAEFARFELAAGDLVLALDRPLISTGLKWAVLKETDVPALLLQRVARLTPDVTRLSTKYLQLWVQSPHFRSGISPGRSIGVPHISTKELAALPIHLPPLDVQERIIDQVEKQTTRLSSNVASLRILAKRSVTLRRALLARAFSGQLSQMYSEEHHG